MSMLIKLLCLFGVHVSGRTGQSCLHNITVCSHCKRDVLFVLHDETKRGSGCGGDCDQGRRPCACYAEAPKCEHDWRLVSDPWTTNADTSWFECSKCGEEEGLL